jgi:hypothetical protein
MKRTHSAKELTQLQIIKRENDRLKRQISSLRKQFARLDVDRFKIAKELIEEHYTEDRADQGRQILDSLKQQWACKICADGYLEIFIYNRGNETYYYRICSSAPFCLNRTKSQIYTPSVPGIIRKDKGTQT